MKREFTLRLNADSAAFEDGCNAEIVRILRNVANRIENGDDFNMYRNVSDVNGNIVGTFALKEVKK